MGFDTNGYNYKVIVKYQYSVLLTAFQASDFYFKEIQIAIVLSELHGAGCDYHFVPSSLFFFLRTLLLMALHLDLLKTLQSR